MSEDSKETAVSSKTDGKRTGEDDVQFWMEQIDASTSREEAWLKRAVKAVDLYEGEKRGDSPFNILYSNTDTLMPALYSNTPRTQVLRRFKDEDPLAAAASTALTRIIDYTLDSNEEEYPEFDELANQAILEALVPGRGAVRWKYDATIKEEKDDGVTRADYSGVTHTNNSSIFAEDAGLSHVAVMTENVPAEGDNMQQTVPTGTVSGERVCGEFVPYDRILMGYARKWKDVPWLAFIHNMTEEEVEENFGKAVVKQVTFAKAEDDKNDGGKKESEKDDRKLATVYEIWDKSSRKVQFMSPGCKTNLLKSVADPLALQGFYPMAEPLMFQRKISTMVPTTPYDIYADQAEELNAVSRRITAIVKMLKVRGLYDQTVEGLDKVMAAGDGVMIAAENVSSLQPGQKLENALWLMPLEPLVAVLQQLLLQRTNIKQVIYEITGISDILRGATQASETATAQKIKNEWGSLRLKKMQKIVQKWARNNLRIVGEIAGKRFSVETFQKITGLPYITQAVMQQAQQQMQQGRAQAMQQMQMNPGQPPAPPPQQLLDTLATPVWEAVIDLLRNPDARSFRVNIETNSTIADDMQEDQKNIGDLLNALSQWLNGITPLIQSGSMPFAAAKSIMLAIVRRMQFGPDIEKQLEDMQAPPPPAAPPGPPPPPVDPNIQLKQQAEAARLQGDMQKHGMEMQFAAQEHSVKMAEMEQKLKLNAHTHNFKMQAAEAKAKQVMQAAATAASENSKGE